MRPLKLQLSGFTCFREETEISFDGLELFAIAGPTGAGKSTLLDAISYALYGQTARLGSKGLEALISPGLQQMSVGLEFRSSSGTIYRVTRVSERKGSRPTNQTRIERLGEDAKWRQLPESEKIKEANAKLSELVGLDYEGFTRAVLLPQGAFDEFLRGNASERRKLLVNLLGLDKIERIQKLAGERYKGAEQRAGHIRQLLEQDYAGATPERKRELKDELASLKEQKVALEEARESLNKELQGLDEVKGLLDEQTSVCAQLAKLKAQEADIQADRKAFARAQNAALIVPQLETLEARQQTSTQLQEQQQDLEKRLREAEEGVKLAQTSLTEAEEATRQIPELSERIEALAELRPLLSQLEARGGDLSLADRADDTTDYSDAAWDALQMQKGHLPNLKRALREVTEAKKSLTGAQQAISKGETQVATLGKELEAVKAKGKRMRERCNQAEASLKRAEVEDRAGALRAHLHVGEACPVCQQTVATLPTGSAVDVAALQRTYDEQKAALDELLEHYRQLDAQLGTEQARLDDRRAEQLKTEATLTRQREQLAEVNKAFASFPTTELADIEKQLEGQRICLLANLAKSIRVKAQGLHPQEAHARLTAERKGLEQTLKTANEGFQAAQRSLDQLQTKQKLLAERLAELTAELAKAQASFEAALGRAAFANAQEVRAAELSEPRSSVLEARIKNFERELEGAQRHDVDVQRKLAGRTLDTADYEALKTQQTETNKALEETQRRVGAVCRDLETLEAQLERASNLRQEAKQCDQVYATYRQLSLDLRSNEFPDFMISRVQQQLAQRASDTIRSITGGRYDLYFRDGEYSVLDAWSSGELRSARTLSGGESFITSLALALALSDTLAGATSLGALFLDEGFGTLDAETLDAVAGVLESLTASGRMVGIITHVAALSERLPARLVVQKGIDGSSVAWDS